MRCECRVRFVPLQLLVVILLSSPLRGQGHQTGNAASESVDIQPPGMFDLEAARRYEGLSRWKEAEQEYLQAGKAGPLWMKQEALSAIERISVHRSADYENYDFELGKMYEDNKEWKDAEQHYSAAAKDAPRPVRDRILLDVERVRGHQRLAEFVEDFTRWLGYVATVLGLLFAIVIVGRVWKTRKGIQVMPFEGSSDDASKRILFSLSSAREQLPNLLAPSWRRWAQTWSMRCRLSFCPALRMNFPIPRKTWKLAELNCLWRTGSSLLMPRSSASTDAGMSAKRRAWRRHESSAVAIWRRSETADWCARQWIPPQRMHETGNWHFSGMMYW